MRNITLKEAGDNKRHLTGISEAEEKEGKKKYATKVQQCDDNTWY